jgi:hypothetical protein
VYKKSKFGPTLFGPCSSDRSISPTWRAALSLIDTLVERNQIYGMKTACITFGAVFILVGILGFVPAVTPNEHLLGIFHVNTAHNIVHLATGATAVIAGSLGTTASIVFFRIFGVVYGLIALVGYFAGNQHILGISNNIPDAILHTVIAIAALTLGFSKRLSWNAGRHETDEPTGTRSYT